MIWNIDTLSPEDWTAVARHWHEGFGYKEDNSQDWQDIKKLTDDFREDVRFAIWAFRNDWAADKLRIKNRTPDAWRELKYLKACKAAITALREFAKCDTSGVIEHELASIVNALKTFQSQVKGDYSYFQTSDSDIYPSKRKRGRPQVVPLNRLVQTIDYLWDKHQKGDRNREFFDLLDTTLIAAQYNVGGKNIEEVAKLYNRVAKLKFKEVVPPLADLAFIHGDDARLYLRSGELAINTYLIGNKVMFPHWGQIGALESNAANIPAPIKEPKCWVCWKAEKLNPKTGKYSKVPYSVRTGKRLAGVQGTPEYMANLGTYEEAIATFHADNSYAGIGIVTLQEFGIVAEDYDNCIVTDGVIRPDVLKATDNTYAERSPSGKGVRAISLGIATSGKNHEAGFELFASSGFVTITGNQIQNCHYHMSYPLQIINDEMRGMLEAKANAKPRNDITGKRVDPVIEAFKSGGLYERDMGRGKHSVKCPFEDRRGNLYHSKCRFEGCSTDKTKRRGGRGQVPLSSSGG